MITTKDLKKALNRIGWKISDSHNGLNHMLINHKGETTMCCVENNERIEIRNKESIFGSAFCGSVVFDFEDITLGEDKSTNAVNLIAGNHTALSFYNFDMKKP